MGKIENLELLKSDDKKDIRFAILELSEFQEEDVVKGIVKAVLRVKLKSVTIAALEVLKGFTSIKEIVIKESIQMIFSENPKVRAAGIEILASFGDDSLKQLEILLADEDYNHRKYALDVLADIHSKGSLSLIGSMLKDNNPNVRYTAVESLQNFKQYKDSLKIYIKVLIDFLEPADTYGVVSVYESMIKTDIKDSSLIDTIEKKLQNTRDQFVRHYLYKMLLFQGEKQYLNDAKNNAQKINLLNELEKELERFNAIRDKDAE